MMHANTGEVKAKRDLFAMAQNSLRNVRFFSCIGWQILSWVAALVPIVPMSVSNAELWTKRGEPKLQESPDCQARALAISMKK